ncbi:MAG: peptidoglycan DD-metalloendopeptidase family protein [Crocinitomicaceae bacterium]|nr:peptidoglycan DD-metalloendopeptidase family protein [Crocinitomicaceae bacterium]MDG1776306.1 peptidoglycan DD-metalloendopeptidase family protein [Crocinitomicaceae bacterium]
MNSVSRLLLTCFLTFTFVGFGQSTSDKLKREQARLEQKISDTKFLLSKSQTAKETSLNELKVIENQIIYREQLLKNYDNQIRAAELTVQSKTQQIDLLHEKIERLKKQYEALLLYAYKHRNKYGKMMSIFSSGSYFEAVKRAKYLERISEIQQQQFLAIQQNQALIKEEIKAIEKEKQYKVAIIQEKSKEKDAIESDRKKQQEVYQKFKLEESILIAKLAEEEQNKKVLRDRINTAIRNEIAAAEARRKKKEAERKRLAAEKAAANATATVANRPEPTFSETNESMRLNTSFKGNKGRLPWPVDKGSITENFGKNAHSTLRNVTTNNRGIDISTPKNAQVRAVFEGEVTSVLKIPGAGKVVIIKHGDYRTVYSNLQDTYVISGMKVSTKKVIGSLLLDEARNMSVAHFEIHHVVGSTVTCLNPALWVSH